MKSHYNYLGTLFLAYEALYIIPHMQKVGLLRSGFAFELIHFTRLERHGRMDLTQRLRGVSKQVTIASGVLHRSYPEKDVAQSGFYTPNTMSSPIE